jgi:peroxiredoxin
MKLIGTMLTAVLLAATAEAKESFELKQMNGDNAGQMYRSADYPGPVWVFEFYFNTCPYCNDNAPLIDRLAEQFQAEPRVQVLDISRDCRDSDYRSWISKHSPNHPVLNDCSKVLITPHNVRGFPTTVVVDCNGKVQYRKEGAMSSSDYDRAVSAIEASLNQPCRTPRQP